MRTRTWMLCASAVATLIWGTVPAAPGLLNYQGRLTDASDNPIASPVNVTFTFWDADTGGAQLGAGFSDTDTVTPDAVGLYSTFVGDDPGIPIPASVFAGDSVWLNVNVGGEDLAPRMRVTSVGFAVHASMADALGGLTADDVLPRSGGAYVVVKTTSSPAQNGANLLAAYATAKALTPHGSPLTSSNRAVVLVPPGRYDLATGQLTLDTDYVDLVGLTNSRDNQWIVGASNGPNSGVLGQTANEVHIENLVVECALGSGSVSLDSSDPAAYWPDTTTTTHTLIRNCWFTADNGHAWSMRVGCRYNGTYENCTAGPYSFGGAGGLATGSFTGCTGSALSFGGRGGTASGRFTDCTAGNAAFAGDDSPFSNPGTASGVFVRCTAGENAFGGGGGTASGLFTNCAAHSASFGGQGGVANGTFTDCTGEIASFGGGGGTAAGVFTDCTGGESSFGGGGLASGTFIRCGGGYYAFGGGGGTASGLFVDCGGSYQAFGGGSGAASGTFRDCTAGDGAFGGGLTGGTAGGIFRNCVAGNYSFGGGHFGSSGQATGTFINCTGTDNAFGGSNDGGGMASGAFTDCTGGTRSFAGGDDFGGTASGTFTRCTGRDKSFGGSFGNPGNASGTFVSCTGGICSFGLSPIGGQADGGEFRYCWAKYGFTTNGSPAPVFQACFVDNAAFP